MAEQELERGLAALLKKPTKRKRSQATEEVSLENALEYIKKGVRHASNPVEACRKVISATETALGRSPAPMNEIVAVLGCLFQRSKVFRSELVPRLNAICRSFDTKRLYTVDLLKMLHEWDAQYASMYPQLRAAVSGIPPRWLAMLEREESTTQRQQEQEEAEKRMKEIQFQHMQQQVDAGEQTILAHVESMERTLGMLIPTVEDCFSALLPTSRPTHTLYNDSDDDGDWEDVHAVPDIESWSLPEVIASCGLGSASYTLSVPIPDMSSEPDLKLVRATLQEQSEEVRKRLLPRVLEWRAVAQQQPTSDYARRLAQLEKLLRTTMEKVSEVEAASS